MDGNQCFLREGQPEDLAGIMAVMEAARQITRPSSWFVPDGPDYVAAHLAAEKGFVLAAQAPGGQIAAFLMVHLPGLSGENLGYNLGFSRRQLEASAHMDSVAVLPAFQGNRLQARLLALGEERLAEMGYRHLLATVHPDNRYSLENFLNGGYQIAATVEKYGGLPRHILRKEISP